MKIKSCYVKPVYVGGAVSIRVASIKSTHTLTLREFFKGCSMAPNKRVHPATYPNLLHAGKAPICYKWYSLKRLREQQSCSTRSGDNGSALGESLLIIKRDTIKRKTLLGCPVWLRGCVMTLGGVSDKVKILRSAKKRDGKKWGPLGNPWNSELINPEAVPPLENLISLTAIFILNFKPLWSLFSVSCRQGILTETTTKLTIKRTVFQL